MPLQQHQTPNKHKGTRQDLYANTDNTRSAHWQATPNQKTTGRNWGDPRFGGDTRECYALERFQGCSERRPCDSGGLQKWPHAIWGSFIFSMCDPVPPKGEKLDLIPSDSLERFPDNRERQNELEVVCFKGVCEVHLNFPLCCRQNEVERVGEMGRGSRPPAAALELVQEVGESH